MVVCLIRLMHQVVDGQYVAAEMMVPVEVTMVAYPVSSRAALPDVT